MEWNQTQDFCFLISCSFCSSNSLQTVVCRGVSETVIMSGDKWAPGLNPASDGAAPLSSDWSGSARFGPAYGGLAIAV